MIQLDNYRALVAECSVHHAQLVSVSKDKSVADIQALYNTGQRVFGENRVQELTAKATQLPNDIQWHLIGHLQTNKVKLVAPFIAMIQSIDSLRLLEEVDKRAAENNRVIDCLLQVHIATEETKFGLSDGELSAMLSSASFQALRNVRICGLMGIASLTDNQDQVRAEFHSLKNLFESTRKHYFGDVTHFSQLSMGMSSDYRIALEEGSTMVRVGSLIFGSR